MRWTRALLIASLVALPVAAQHDAQRGDPAHSAHGDPMPIDRAPALAPEAPPASPAAREHRAHSADRGGDPAGAARGAQDEHSAHTAQSAQAGSEDAAHPSHHGMVLDAAGMVMNHNPDRLPRDCAAVSGEVDVRVRAGRAFAQGHGLVYGYDDPVWNVAPCSKVNVTLENDDSVRHQWMVHGLPRYLYPGGMFTLEVNGPGTRSASLIVPSAAMTYLVHCDVPHHMEKGMKGQLVVGAGAGNLPGVPGVSAPLYADRYPTRWTLSAAIGGALAVVLGLSLSLGLRRS